MDDAEEEGEGGELGHHHRRQPPSYDEALARNMKIDSSPLTGDTPGSYYPDEAREGSTPFRLLSLPIQFPCGEVQGPMPL